MVDSVQPRLHDLKGGLLVRCLSLPRGKALARRMRHCPLDVRVACVTRHGRSARQRQLGAWSRAIVKTFEMQEHLEVLEVRGVAERWVPLSSGLDAVLHGPAHMLEARVAFGHGLTLGELVLVALRDDALTAPRADAVALLREWRGTLVCRRCIHP